jgi:hypothetical protein
MDTANNSNLLRIKTIIQIRKATMMIIIITHPIDPLLTAAEWAASELGMLANVEPGNLSPASTATHPTTASI